MNIEDLTPNKREELFNCNAPMDDKWRAAYNLLDGDQSGEVQPWNRCAAVCWLIYRALEGKVAHDEMMRRVMIHNEEVPKNMSKLHARWLVSMATARFYYYFMHDLKAHAYKEAERMDVSHLLMNVSATMNYLRVNCICAYDQFLAGQTSEAGGIITYTISAWQEVHKDLPWSEHPLRFFDLSNDSQPLHCMMIIAQKLGILKAGLRPVHLVEMGQDFPWVKCMKSLAHMPGAIWHP